MRQQLIPEGGWALTLESHPLLPRLCVACRAGSPGEGQGQHTPVAGSSFRLTSILLLSLACPSLLCRHC